MEKIYQSVLEKLPGISRIDKMYGHKSLEEYTSDFFKYISHSIQPIDDLIEVISSYAGRLLGPATAKLLSHHFAESPVALTANHHGVDYKSFTVQGTIIYALPRLSNSFRNSSPVIPVFACGLVPLCNKAFPLGIILSREKDSSYPSAGISKNFLKVNVIPWKYSQSLVSTARSFDSRMVSYAYRKVERLYNRELISEGIRKSLLSILSQEYARDEVLSQKNYSDQAVVLNKQIWRRMFAPELRDQLPELAYLEMERISSALIVKDLSNENSLFHNFLFDNSLRNELLQALDKHIGCWDLRKLRRLADSVETEHPGSEKFRGCGTLFFWYVDSKGRRVPLLLSEGKAPNVLTGIAPGTDIRISFTPDALREALQERKLLPSLFSSFTALAFARGVKCFGGFYQVDYLPAMQQGLIEALEVRGMYEWSRQIALVPTANFVTGMNIALAVYPDCIASPAGAVEIIASGGLTAEHLEQIKSLSLSEANMSGLMETYQDFIFRDNPDEESIKFINGTNLKCLDEKMVSICF